MRTLEYNKTKTTVLYSKHKILEIPYIFKLFVAKFMYSFYNGGLLNHSDNHFAEIASVHKYQTRLASLQKYYLPRMKTSMGQLSLKYTGPKTGPVLSRFDRFLPIRPRAEGDPAPLKPTQSFTLYRSWLWMFPARDPMFFKEFWDQNSS